MTGRDRRRNAQPNAAMYVGYADDDEDVESIMAKFAAVEEATKAKGASGDANASGDVPGQANELTEEELIRATGARAPPKERVDYSAQLGNARANRKGEVVVAGVVELVPGHVHPEEIDAADAEDAIDRLRAGAEFAPEEQRECAKDAEEDDEDPAMGEPSKGIVPGEDVAMVELKGFDAYTREKIVENLPASIEPREKDDFVNLVSQTMRLAAVDGGVVSIEAAAKTIADDKASTNEVKHCAKTLAKLCAKDGKEYKAKSKGVGLVVIKPEGIKKGKYLGAYCGELYPAWRWFEKEAAAQAVRRDVRRDDEVPTFYNAAVERDRADPRGYDVLFIDGMVKGSVLTRASHSCEPNAEMRVRVRTGKYSVEMVTTRDVKHGEEICWDYRCQTDSEKEMRRAICLCGSKHCRVSYLHYNGESELATFADSHCAVAHNAARLLASCVDSDSLDLPHPPVKSPMKSPMKSPGKGGTPGPKRGHTRADDHWKSALIAAGVRADDEGMLRGLPQWARKFASKCVATVFHEKQSLTRSLYESAKVRAAEAAERAIAERAAYESDPEAWLKSAGKGATEPPVDVPTIPDADLRADAKAEASGIHSARVQSLAVTMDKVRHVLAVHKRKGGADEPTSGVDVSEAAPPLELLNDDDAASHLVAYMRNLGTEGDESPGAEGGAEADPSGRLNDVRERLRRTANRLWTLAGSAAGEEDRVESIARGDLAWLASETRNFFVARNGGARFKSPYVAMGSIGDGAGVVRQVSLFFNFRKSRDSTDNLSCFVCVQMDYPAHSALGFLAAWHEEYLEKPRERLERDMRGALSLPQFVSPTSSACAGRKKAAVKFEDLPAHLLREMSARGGGKPWGPVDDCWRWNVNLDTSVMGSPIVDLILGGERNPGAAAAAKLNAARKAALGDDADAWAAKAEEKAPSEKAPSEKAPSSEPKIESEIKSEPDADVAEAAALIAHTDAATVDRRREPRVVTDHPLNRWGEPEPNVTCLVCGDFGDDSEFVLCDGCPAGGHLDCLKLLRKPDSGDDWHCDACEGGKLAGIQPPGRAGFEAAAVNRAALEAARERGGATGGASVSSVPGATGAVRFYFLSYGQLD